MSPIIRGPHAALLLLAGGLIAACSGGSGHESSTGPGDWVAGDYPADLGAQTYLQISDIPGQPGLVREYKVHVPPSYVPTVPMPVVYCIHGTGQNAVMFCVNGAGAPAKADAEGFILVMPNGYKNTWNGGTCCGTASDMQLDDIAFYRAIFAELRTHLNIDLKRVYAMGYSSGGFMGYRLGCEASDLFTAVFSGSGALGTNEIAAGPNTDSDFVSCTPAQPFSILDTHGTADTRRPYAVQKPSLDAIAALDGCSLETESATAPVSQGDTQCVTYTGCPAGITVTGCTITGGGHCWYGSDSCGTGAGVVGALLVGPNSSDIINTDAAWNFFASHQR